jgi:hypothetical protein
MNEHWLLYTSDREHGGKVVIGIFNSEEEAYDYYTKTTDANDRYWNIAFVERWENNNLIEEK